MVTEESMGLLVSRLEESGAEVLTATPDTLSQVIIGLIGRRGWHRLVSVRRNRVGHPSVLGDEPPVGPEEMEGLDAVISESALAVAAAGAVVLDHGPGQGRPVFNEIAGIRVCVVDEDQVVEDAAQARAVLGEQAPLSWITGPAGPAGGGMIPRPLIVVLVTRP